MSVRQPLRFDHLPQEKVWGGRSLEPFLGRSLDTTGPVGEVWTLVDRDGSSSTVSGGDFDRRTLRGLMMSETEALLGATGTQAGGYFPLLIKYLDARQNLSIQVHPDQGAASRIGGEAQSKNECWYILSADEGACVWAGLREGLEPQQASDMLQREAASDALSSWQVKAGDFFFIPAGTVHAIGAGITLVEIQENSDTTYRIHDWGRVGLDGEPREVHTDRALVSIDYDRPYPGPVRVKPEGSGDVRRAVLTEQPCFGVELLAIDGTYSPPGGSGEVEVLIILEGVGHLRAPEGGGEWELCSGETWLLPADLGETELSGVGLRLLEVRPPRRDEDGEVPA